MCSEGLKVQPLCVAELECVCVAACWWPGAAVVSFFLLVYLEASNLNMCVSVCAGLLMSGGLVLLDAWSTGAVELNCCLCLHVSSLLLNCCLFSFEFEKTITFMLCCCLYCITL
jgi:hypothetical protein